MYDLYIRYAGGAAGGQLSVMVNGSNVSGIVTLPATGGYGNYATYLVPGLVVSNVGPAVVQINCVSPGYDLVWVEFVAAGGAPLPPIGETVVGAQPGVPAGLTAGVQATPGNAAAALSWVPCESATSYNVKRSLAQGGPYSIAANCSTLSYLDRNLTNGLSYYYVCRQ